MTMSIHMPGNRFGSNIEPCIFSICKVQAVNYLCNTRLLCHIAWKTMEGVYDMRVDSENLQNLALRSRYLLSQ